MNDRIEEDLRRMLARQAAEVPVQARSRLSAVDYGPRSPLLVRGLTLSGVVSVAAGAAVAVSILGFGASTQNAFAGWSATPTASRSAQTAAAVAECKTAVEKSTATTDRRIEKGALRGPAVASMPMIAPSDWQVAITDTRGPFTLVLLEADGGEGTSSCLSDATVETRSGSHMVGAMSIGLGGTKAKRVPAGKIKVGQFSQEELSTEEEAAPGSGKPYVWVSGRIGAGVSGVTLALNDGRSVTASIANGHLIAWWPGKAQAIADEVTTASGTVRHQLYNPMLEAEREETRHALQRLRRADREQQAR